MGRGNLVNSIPKMQIEWATKYSHSSIRNYLIEVKGLTERQYRYILKKAPLKTWATKRQSIEAKTEEAQIETYVERVSKTAENQIRSANLAFLKITNQIAKYDPIKHNSTALLNLSKALREAQDVAFKALGLTEDSMRRVYALNEENYQNLKQVNTASKVDQINAAAARLDYEDIVDLLKAQSARRKKQREELS